MNLLLLDLAGLALLGLFVVAVISDILNMWPCASCGLPDDNPLHYPCTNSRGTWVCRTPNAHHTYQKTAWPFFVLAVAMGLVLVGFLVLR